MNKTKAECLALLNETAAHYKNSNRAINPDNVGFAPRCMYETPDGKQCAIGRKVPDLALRIKMNSEGGIRFNRAWQLLPEELRDYGQDFLASVQNFHDCDDHWDDEGMSAKGAVFYQGIIRQFKLDVE